MGKLWTGTVIFAWCLLSLGCASTSKIQSPQPNDSAPSPEESVSSETPKQPYLLVALAGKGLHPESARRVIRRLRDYLTETGRPVTLDQDFQLTERRRGEQSLIFEKFFREPSSRESEKVKQWMTEVGAGRLVICQVEEYRQYWKKDKKVNRIVLSCMYADFSQSDPRPDRFQVIAEKEGPVHTFDDTEDWAAQKIFSRLGLEKKTDSPRRWFWEKWF